MEEKEIESLETAFKESLQLKTPPPRRRTANLEVDGTISVFNGYVSCKQLALVLNSYMTSPIKLLLHHQRKNKSGEQGGGKGAQGQAAKVLMRGPGGIGSAEVAVTSLESGSSSGKGGSDAKMLAKAFLNSAVAAVRTAVQGGDEQSSISASTDSISVMKLQCALMAVNMPVEALAEQILKGI